MSNSPKNDRGAIERERESREDTTVGVRRRGTAEAKEMRKRSGWRWFNAID